ncbi:MAG: tyrosine-type recombinase/integrase [Acidobacteriota bacterium]
MQQETATILGAWVDHLVVVRGLSEASVSRYERHVGRLLEGVDDPATLDGGDLDRYLKRLYHLGRGRPTLRLAVTAARSFGQFLVYRGLAERTPFGAVIGPRGYRREAPALSVSEVRRLIYGPHPGRLPVEPLSARNRVVLAVMYGLGLRRGEVGPLRVDNLKIEESSGCWAVLVRGAKWSDHDSRLWIEEPLINRLVGAYLAGPRQELVAKDPECPWLFPSTRPVVKGGAKRRPLSAWAVGDIVKRGVEEAGIEARGRRLSSHILRHSVATHLLQGGAGESVVQQFLRHADPRSTRVYLHPGERGVRKMWKRARPLRQGGRAAGHRTGVELLEELRRRE